MANIGCIGIDCIDYIGCITKKVAKNPDFCG
jgi:hypothetical protein